MISDAGHNMAQLLVGSEGTLGLVVAAVIAGFVGIAIVSTVAGQYAIAGIICAIATYWLMLANDHHLTH